MSGLFGIHWTEQDRETKHDCDECAMLLIDLQGVKLASTFNTEGRWKDSKKHHHHPRRQQHNTAASQPQ